MQQNIFLHNEVYLLQLNIQAFQIKFGTLEIIKIHTYFFHLIFFYV